MDSNMSNEPTETRYSETNTPQDSNDQALISMELSQTELLGDIDLDEIEQILAEYDPTFNQAAMDEFLANFNVPTPPPESSPMPSRPPPQLVNSQEAMQAYLIQMQVYAGIPEENIQPMHSSGTAGRYRGPVLFRYTNNDLRIPLIPPATFTGRLAPLPSHDNISWNLQTLEYVTGLTQNNCPPNNQIFVLNRNIGAAGLLPMASNDDDLDVDVSETDDSSQIYVAEDFDDIEIQEDGDTDESESMQS